MSTFVNEPPSLLLISWNRTEYLKKTLISLFSDASDFRVYCWDNGSDEQTRSLIQSVKDDRVVERHFHGTNVNQAEPVRWFLEVARDGLVGKIDDDVLLPAGWTQQLARAITSSERFGMLGCWIYLPEDYLPDIAEQNICTLSGHRVLRCTSIAGHSFLARRNLLKKYVATSAYIPGIPIDRRRMTLDGFISGYPVPLISAINMDDPRSSHCRMKDTGLNAPDAALTARRLGFNSLETYARWIRCDALQRQAIPWQVQYDRFRQDEFRSRGIGRLLHRAEQLVMKYTAR